MSPKEAKDKDRKNNETDRSIESVALSGEAKRSKRDANRWIYEQ
jgi:hypothetical protein